MSRYFDASVLVPLFVDESGSDRARTILVGSSDPPLVSTLAEAEFASALSLKIRMGELPHDEAARSLRDFDGWLPSLAEPLGIENDDIVVACVIVRRFELKLRAPDAIHIAAALRHRSELVTFDNRMAEAARALQLTVISE